MDKVTCWYRLENNQWKYNHYEDGWTDSKRPIPLFPHQKKAWKGYAWSSEHCYMKNHKIISIEATSP